MAMDSVLILADELGSEDNASEPPHVAAAAGPPSLYQPANGEQLSPPDMSFCCYGLLPSDRTMLLCISVAAATSLLLGYDQGVMSGAKLSIEHDLNLSQTQTQLMVGILHVSAVGALGAGWMADKWGRKPTIALACLVFFVGALVMALARDYTTLMVGRVITGMGVGTGLSVSPLYLSELSPKHIRGALVSLTEISINIGVLLGFIAGWAFDGLGDHVSWRYMLGMGALPPVFIYFSLVFLPESPRWLLKQGRRDDAYKVLTKTSSAQEAAQTLEDLTAEVKRQEALPQGSWRDLFGSRAKGHRRLVIAGLLVAVFQQASGLEALLYYVPEVLEHAGIEDKETQLLANIGVGAVKVSLARSHSTWRLKD
jgi:sugar porter (SP) family MFS transporter